MKKYDVIVIGSGGGSKISSPVARLGHKVALLEREDAGGTCLNRGCIPSKMLIHPANLATEITEAGKFGLDVTRPYPVRFGELVERVTRTVAADSAGLVQAYEKHPNIDFYHAAGKFISDKVLAVENTQITADKIFIAAGARPQIPPIPGLSNTPFLTSTEALRNTHQPKKMIVIGAGYIAAELGHFYGALGTEVHFLVRSRFLKNEDHDVAAEFFRVFSRKYQVHLGVNPVEVSYNQEMFTVVVQDGEGKKTQMIADALLVATGVVPNSDQLGLENTAIRIGRDGFIQVDDHLRTAVPGVWALGDVIGRYLFRHSVNFEGEYLMRTVFEQPGDEPLRYPPMPHAVFSYPEIAAVGKTEDELKKEGVSYIVGLNPYKSSAKGMALLSDHGFCKLLFDRSSRRLLGAHIIGPEASDMIHMPVAYMNMNATLDDMLRTIYIHPALPEIVRNAARKAREQFERSH